MTAKFGNGDPVSEITPNECHLLRHALGLNDNGTRFAVRNNFVSYVGTEDDATWRSMLDRGLAAIYVSSDGWNSWFVTDEGKLAQQRHGKLPKGTQ